MADRGQAPDCRGGGEPGCDRLPRGAAASYQPRPVVELAPAAPRRGALPAPFHVIPRGRAGPELLATILQAKFSQHLPLNRQSETFAREGIERDVSTLADWIGACTATLAPLVELIRAHVLAAERIHGDDTTVPGQRPLPSRKLNGLDPRAWLADVLRRIADHPASRRDELLPWNCVERTAKLAA